MPITAQLLEVAHTTPDQLAIVGDHGERLTYAELLNDSITTHATIKALLHDTNHNPGHRIPEARGLPIVAVCLSSAFHAARIMAGMSGYPVIFATVDARWPLDHQVDIVTKTCVDLLICDSHELAQALAETRWAGKIVTLDQLIAKQRAHQITAKEIITKEADLPQVRHGAEPYLMLFSSGTTSNPKAFMKTREQYRANFAVSSAHLAPGPQVATLAPGPMSYSLTLYAAIECLASGGSVHVADTFEPVTMATRIAAEGITRVVAVPAVVQSLADVARRNPDACSGLELVVTGGANLPARIRKNLAEVLPGTRLISYYGAAELGFIGDSRGGDGTLIDIYNTIGTSVRDTSGQPVAEGETGTLWIKAKACSTGYVAATTQAVLMGPDGWATVGDQARMVGERLELLGRSGDIVITGGHKVSLPQVEHAFDDLLGPGHACAISLPHPSLGSIVGLVIEEWDREGAAGEPGKPNASGRNNIEHMDTRGPGKTPSKVELLNFARGHLAPQFVPRQWYVVKRLPRTVGGKIRREATARLVAAGGGQRL